MARRVIVVDASFDDERGVAGIGVGFQRGPAIGSEALNASSIEEAEALAITRGLAEMIERGFSPGSIVVCDNLGVVRAIERGEDIAGLGRLIRELALGGGFEIERRPRKEVKVADRVARQSLRIWRAGLQREGTWQPVEVTV